MSDRNERQFIDTSILVYAHDISAGGKHSIARKLVTDLWHSACGCLSIQVLQEFYVIATRKVSIPITDEAAITIIGNLSKWTVHLPDAEDIIAAVKARHCYHISFWDAMILCSTEKLGCSTLWTEDLNHGQTFGQVTVLNPFIA
jgi:predicted nucleic acid-binding protein